MKKILLQILVLSLYIVIAPTWLYIRISRLIRGDVKREEAREFDDFLELVTSFEIIPNEYQLIVVDAKDRSAAGWARDGKVYLNYNELNIMPNYIIKGTMKHELIHCIQFAKGRLKYNEENKNITWQGVTKSMNEWYGGNLDGSLLRSLRSIYYYYTLPWELEAYKFYGLRKILLYVELVYAFKYAIKKHIRLL